MSTPVPPKAPTPPAHPPAAPAHPPTPPKQTVTHQNIIPVRDPKTGKAWVHK